MEIKDIENIRYILAIEDFNKRYEEEFETQETFDEEQDNQHFE